MNGVCVYLYVCVYVCVCVCLNVCQSVSLSVSVPVSYCVEDYSCIIKLFWSTHMYNVFVYKCKMSMYNVELSITIIYRFTQLNPVILV